MGLLFLVTMEEPAIKRAVAFFDGQNLFRHAKSAFGHTHPNYDPQKLFQSICERFQWTAHGVRFYTGVPSAAKDPQRHAYWTNRLLAFRRSGILVENRSLRYRSEVVRLPDGTMQAIETAQEKGIDIRIALDIIRLTMANQLDVVVIFSQDQDLSEVSKEIREIAKSQNRWIQVVCAFPSGPNATSSRGINGTDWVEIDEEWYNSCLDHRDYRAPKDKASS